MNNQLLKDSIKLCVKKVLTANKYKRPELILAHKILAYAKENNNIDFKCQYPFKVYWKILADCNLRCKHCFFYGKAERFISNNDLSSEQITSLINEFAEMNVINLILTGGEIFLRKDIFDIIKKISLSKLSTVVKEQIKIVPNSNLVFISIAEAIKLEQALGNPFLEILGLQINDFASNRMARKFLDNHLKNIKKSDSYNCSCHNDNKAYIDSQGDIYLCHIVANNPSFKIGNMKNKSFKDVWNNRAENVFFQNRDSYNMACSKCKYVPLCLGGCPFYAQEKYKTILAPGGNCALGCKLINAQE